MIPTIVLKDVDFRITSTTLAARGSRAVGDCIATVPGHEHHRQRGVAPKQPLSGAIARHGGYRHIG